MTYRPVIDRFAVPLALDPPSAVLFVAVFIAAALVTARRPAYGLCALVFVTPFAFAHELLGTSITIEKAALLGVLIGLTTYRGNAALLRRAPAPALSAALCAFILVTALTAIDAVALGNIARELNVRESDAGVRVSVRVGDRVQKHAELAQIFGAHAHAYANAG